MRRCLLLVAGPALGVLCACAGVGEFRMERTDVLLDCANACDPIVPTAFVDMDFTELDKVSMISLFRSAAGHDYSDECEDCRSMKHYFAPYAAFGGNGVIAIRSPVDGQIVSITNEQHGLSAGLTNKQVRVRSSLHPEYTFILFHLDLLPGVAAGDSVVAGQALATAHTDYPELGETGSSFDLAVRVHTQYGDRLVSWFDVMTDSLFAEYLARGATARSDLILTKAQRDADALTCSGETFTSVGVLAAWFDLDPP